MGGMKEALHNIMCKYMRSLAVLLKMNDTNVSYIATPMPTFTVGHAFVIFSLSRANPKPFQNLTPIEYFTCCNKFILYNTINIKQHKHSYTQRNLPSTHYVFTR